jgi:hypothetical protein
MRGAEMKPAMNSLIVERRQIAGSYLDEEDLMAISIDEVARLTVAQPAELGFIVPCVTITAGARDEEPFIRSARRELGEWHRWLNSGLGSGNKRRLFRLWDALDHFVLISGVLIRDGKVDGFAEYEKEVLRRRRQTP